jgi:hypothetical protein
VKHLAEVPVVLRSLVAEHLAPKDTLRIWWTVRHGVLWITEQHWILSVGPAAEHRSTGKAGERAFDLLDRPVPPAVASRRDVERHGAIEAIPLGEAFVEAGIVRLIEAYHGVCDWHGTGELDPLYATREGRVVAVTMPMRWRVS